MALTTRLGRAAVPKEARNLRITIALPRPVSCWVVGCRQRMECGIEALVHRLDHAITPETLRRLQDIYEAAWAQLLRQKSRHTFPWEAESARFLLAQLVLEHARDGRAKIDIVKDVVKRIETAVPKACGALRGGDERPNPHRMAEPDWAPVGGR